MKAEGRCHFVPIKLVIKINEGESGCDEKAFSRTTGLWYKLKFSENHFALCIRNLNNQNLIKSFALGKPPLVLHFQEVVIYPDEGLCVKISIL